MEFINETPFAAALYRTQLELEDDEDPYPDWKLGEGPPPWIGEEEPPETPAKEEVMHSVLIVAARYPIEGTGIGLPAPALQRETPEPDGPDDPAYGMLLEPGSFPRAGTDVIVIGDAIAQRPEATQSKVRIVAGEYSEEFSIFGDRVWERSDERLVPSDPEPFDRVPMTWHHAYGGAAENEYGPLPFGANPEGKGYYLTEEEAEGKPLPNIEDPAKPLQNWSEQPEPVGCGPYPTNWSLRLERCMEVDQENESMTIHPERGLFDFAHPRLSGKRIEEGAVRIEGMTERSPLAFEIPQCPVVVDIAIGERGGTRDLILDEVLVDFRRQIVDLTWRKGFKYVFEPNLTRTTTVRTRSES